MGFQRKRSLSVPLLLSLNPEGLENDGHVHGGHAQDSSQGQGQSGQDLDGDQDMDTDDLTSSSATSVSHDGSSSNINRSTSTALVYDYSRMTMQRESLLATLPRSHRHRAYASNIAKGSPQPSSHSRLYYSNNNHHPHASFRHQYNPFTNRKFPPYQYWAVSAQRDYHLSTIGVLASPSGARSAVHPSSSASGSGGGGATGGGGGTGDLLLRAAHGGSSGGGVNKSVYRSRLPVHLRHITSRNNRRPAICLNAFNGGEGRDEGDMDNARDKKRHSASVLPSSSITASGGGGGGSDQRDQGTVFQVSRTSSSPPPSTGLGSTSASPSRADHQGGESSSSGRGSLSAANRKRLSDWKRVTALSFDLEGDPQRTGMVMRLASNDSSSSIMAPTTSLSSSSSSSSSSVRGSASSGRQWLSQRGGLANLFQNNLTLSGGNAGSGNSSGGGGTNVSNVDRLVEEMTKWSV
ncbi:hypothetical protein BGW39_001645 [Mortierella sp. 14UC]|nr:hypothetical protein BGW39_001645 [Mortierella sp. 14UC]